MSERSSFAAAPVLSALIFAALIGAAGATRAELVTWEYSGSVDQVVDPQGFLQGAVLPESTFLVRHSFDPHTPDSDGDPLRGAYFSAIEGVFGGVGELDFEGPVDDAIGGFENLISIVLGSTSGADIHAVLTQVRMNDRAFRFEITLRFAENARLPNDALFRNPPGIDSLDFAEFRFVSEESGGVSIHGDLSSIQLIPEPETLLFVLVVVLIITGWHR